MELSISIATYNTCEITSRALQSLFDTTSGVTFEVIVVDNGSTDGSAAILAARFPRIRLVRSEVNLGFARAHNLALSHAQGRFLLVVNSDVLFRDNAVKNLVDRLSSSAPSIGAVGPQIINPDGSEAPSSRRRIIYSLPMVRLSIINQFLPFGRLLPVRTLRRYLGKVLSRLHDNFDPPTVLEEVQWVDGMCVLFSREALVQTGLFDEQFFFDYEIGDLLIRMRKAGWRILFDPEIKVVHLGGYSRKLASQIGVESRRSLLIYYAKHKPEYVPFLRSTLLRVTQLRLAVLRTRARVSPQGARVNEEVRILRETRRVVADFEPTQVDIRGRVPALGDVQGAGWPRSDHGP